MGRSKKEKKESDNEAEECEQENGVVEIILSPMAKPLAPGKLTKKVYKVIRKANKVKRLFKGVREVQKFVRKGEKGIVIMAGDTCPIDVISHMPVFCEDQGLSYCFTPSREALGEAFGASRATCMVMIRPHEDYDDLYQKLQEKIKDLPKFD